MPIVHMTNRRENIPNDAVNVQDVSDVWRNSCTEEYRDKFQLFTWESHHGLCLHEVERNGYNDSDFYMIVWNPETRSPATIEFASTRGWSYPCLASKVDATPEVIEQYETWKKEQAIQRAIAHDIEQSKKPEFGKLVKVVRGRKVPIETQGEVCWTGEDRFGNGLRLGIRLIDGSRVFTAASNVEVVNPDQYRRIADDD